MKHNWVEFPLGRRCVDCGLTQERGSYDHSIPCSAVRPPKPTRTM
ncbi:MAG TPA: hypothetical protein VFC53_03610 [Dehalococcoidia bacterium]|nr:hypothetical protein [Dehalococcoidia bacterium]